MSLCCHGNDIYQRNWVICVLKCRQIRCYSKEDRWMWCQYIRSFSFLKKSTFCNFKEKQFNRSTRIGQICDQRIKINRNRRLISLLQKFLFDGHFGFLLSKTRSAMLAVFTNRYRLFSIANSELQLSTLSSILKRIWEKLRLLECPKEI